MSRHALTLPIRTLSSVRTPSSQWICRRCLATQAEQATSTGFPVDDFKRAADPPEEGYDPTLPASKRIGPDGIPYRLKKSDFYLKKRLPQERIPFAYLQHSTSTILHENEKKQREKTAPHKKIVGVVVSAGKMDKCVKVRVAKQTWNSRIGKYFSDHDNHLVHDPNNSLVEGDVVELHRLKVSRRCEHVVASIVSPFGKPVEQRPPIPTPDERLAAYKEKRFAKLQRRDLRARAAYGDADAIQELKDRGLDPGDGAEPGVGKTDNVQSNVGRSRTPSHGAILGEKGQKLPEGVLPGGEHAVGSINERAQHNKGQAMKYESQAEENLLEAEEKAKELEKQGLSSDSALR